MDTLNRDENEFRKTSPAISKYVAAALPPQMRSRLLAQLIPVPSSSSGTWTFACLSSKERLKCKLHDECMFCYKHCDQLLKLMFNGDMPQLRIDMRRIDPSSYRLVISRINKKLHEAEYVRLSELSLSGGTTHTDPFLLSVEKLAYSLRKRAGMLQSLHLPIGSNEILLECSKMPGLVRLVLDRTKHMDNRGLRYLSNSHSHTRKNLRICHIGVFKHKGFSKVDVCKFLVKMSSLTEFSLMDEERILVKDHPAGEEGSGGLMGAKVFAYSALKVAVVDSAFRLQENFVCQLKALKVVDKVLKPDYLLQCCPNLTRLYIDWQDELSEAPFEDYDSSWFNSLLKNPDWKQLMGSLTHLQIAFPTSLEFVFTWTDFNNFVNSIGRLQCLELKGCLNANQPLPLLYILKNGPELKKLCFEKCAVYLPYAMEDDGFQHKTLETLHMKGNTVSLIYHDYTTDSIAHFMPNLNELILTPASVSSCTGFPLLQIRKLNTMTSLERLCLPMSLSDCLSNMPQVVYILREFPVLRVLVVAWGICVDYNPSRLLRLHYWLENTLRAENANIHLELCYDVHSDIYTNPPSSFFA